MIILCSVKIRAVYIFLCIFGTLAVLARNLPNKGVPLLRNYIPAQYQNKGKIWDISSAPNGIVYMAADKGLLEFDGKNWKCFKGSDGFTRSVLVLNDSLIYTGSDLDFGVWVRNRLNAFEYTSLYPFRKEPQFISEEFWNVFVIDNNLIFISSQNIYVYKNQQIIRISAPEKFTGCFAVNNTIYLSDSKNGLYVFEKTVLRQLFSYPDKVVFEISGIYQWNDGIVVVTKDSGLYHYSSGKLRMLKNQLSGILKTAIVFSFEPIGENQLAFGTVLKGLLIADADGNIIHQVNKYKGLLSNTILSLHYSKSGRLWISSEYGVSSLFLRNDITYFYDYRGDFGTGYTAQVMDGVFYLGTNQGLYHARWDDLNNSKEFTRFDLVSGSEGQVWTLEKIDNELLMGHDKGLFVVNKNQMEKLDQHEGVWSIVQYKNHLLTGNYNGISIFRRNADRWIFFKKMDLILGSCNQLIIEKDTLLWANIPNFGIIRAVLDKDLIPIERQIFHDTVFVGDNPRLIKNDKGIWLFTEKYQYFYDNDCSEFRIGTETIFPWKIENVLAGTYQSLPLTSDYDFYPVYNGFALRYLPHFENQSALTFSLILRNAEAFNNNERVAIAHGARLPYQLNNITLEFIVPNQDNVLYQYKLHEDGRWSDWSTANYFEFIGLSSGEHSLFINASINGMRVGIITMTIYIDPPLYRSWYAYMVYFLIMLFIAHLIHRWKVIALKKQKKQLLLKEQLSLRQQAEKHREKIMLLEQERLQSENEFMKQQLRNKTIELANKAKDNEDKNRLLASLKEKFDMIREDDPCIAKLRLNEIRRLLDSYLKVDDKTFEIQMDELHRELFKKLMDKFPSLSSNDLRLCAYLRVGLNSKEIAEIMNIQPSSSYISRSRLRKKLNLKPEEDLYTFLNSLE